MKLKAEITIDNDVDLLYESFKPELKEWKRSTIKVKKNKDSLQFNIQAQDATSFRATLNSITGLLSVYDKTHNLIKKNG